jgi:CRISPR-associated protein Csh1
MLEAIAALGQRRQAAVGAGDSVEMLLEQPSATHVLTFEFGLSQPVYREIQLSEYDPAKAAGYFLTSGPSNGPLGTPTALITDAEKTFRMRIMGWVTKVDKSRSKIRELLPAGQREWLDSFLAECNRSQEAMNADLAKAVESLKGGRNRLLVTCRFRDGAHSQWIGDPALPFRAIYRFLLREEVFGKSSAQGHCSVCGERKDVSGRIASEVFKFATFDKPGFITGGFDQRLIWRNLPVCMDCYVRLKVGREFVEEEMTFRFCGLRYWLVPKFVVDLERSDEALDIIRLWENKQRLDRDMARRIMGEEDEILDILAEQKDFLTLNFVFLERSNAMERILLSVDDVLPSRLRCIFEAKEFVDRVPFLSASKLQYNLRRLSPFFSKTKAGGREEILWTPFLEIIGHILRGQPLDRGTFLAALLGRIRRDVANMRSIHSWDGGIGTWVEWAGDYGQRPVKAGGDDNNGGAHTVDNL